MSQDGPVTDNTSPLKVLEQMIRSHPEPMWIYDAETLRFLLVNEAAVRRYGYGAEQFHRMTIEDIRPPEDVTPIAERIGTPPPEVSSPTICRHRWANGEIRQVETISHALTYAGRRARLVTARDVTERNLLLEDRERAITRERSARAETEAAKARLFNIFQALPGAHLVITPKEYLIIAASEAYFATTMTQFADIVGRPLFEVFPEEPDDPEGDGPQAFRSSFARVEETGQPDAMPVQRYPIPRPEILGGGFEERFWSAVNAPVFGADGKLDYIIHSTEDVTERHRAEEQRRQTQRLLETAGRVARIGGWSLSLDPEAVYWSDAVCDIHEMPKGTTMTLADAVQFYEPSSRELVAAAIRACILEGKPYDQELQINTAKGGKLWVRSIGEAVYGPDGKVIRLEGACQDITERKRADEALFETRQRFSQLANAMPQIVWTADPQGRLDHLNDAFYVYTGGSSEAFPARRWLEYLHPDDFKTTLARWRHARESETLYLTEFRLRGADGAYRWHVARAKPIRDSHGRLVRWYGTVTDVDHRRRSEEETRRLAKRLEATLASIADPFFVLDRDWRFTFVNKAAARLLLRDQAELLGRVLWEEFEEALGTDFETEYRRAANGGVPVDFEAFYPPLGLWLRVSAYPSVEGLAVHLRDVSAEHQRLRQLQESEERFRAVASVTANIIWDWNASDDVAWWSGSLESALSVSPGMGRASRADWTEQVHPEDRARVTGLWAAAIESQQQILALEYRGLREDGSWVDVQCRGRLFYDPHGSVQRIIGSITNISAAKVAERRLRRQAALLDRAQDAIIARDADNIVLFWNEGAERIYGWSEEEAVGVSIETLIHDDPEPFREATRRVMSEGAWTGVLQQRTKSGASITVQGHWSQVKESEDTEPIVMAINTDITAHLELEERLRHSQRLDAVGKLTGGIAHDFNNLLTIITGNAELLIELAGDDSKLKRLAELTQSAAHRGATLTKKLLAFARKQRLEPAEIDLKALLAEAMELIGRTLPASVEITLSVEDAIWPAYADRVELEAALLNLAINARDAMPEGGRLTITASNLPEDEADDPLAPGDYCVIRVADTGCGIHPKHLPRAFEPFFTTKEFGKGTGLGLATVHGFATQSGGDARIKSVVGVGTTVTLYLPRAQGIETDRESPIIPKPSNPKGRILIVEDDDMVRAHTFEILHSLGFEAQAARSGQEALDMLRNDAAFDLVFTDIVMPGGMDGRALGAEIASVRPGTKVLYTSGYVEQDTGPIVPRHLFLRKPYAMHELKTKLAEVLAGTEAHP